MKSTRFVSAVATLAGCREAPALLPEQPVAYIFRSEGDLVWSSLGYLSGFVANIQATRYQVQPVLQAFQGTIHVSHGRGHGTLQILDHRYQQVAQIQGLTPSTRAPSPSRLAATALLSESSAAISPPSSIARARLRSSTRCALPEPLCRRCHRDHLILDNSAWAFGLENENQETLHPHPRALIVQLNHVDNSKTVLQSYASPDHLSAASQGNAQVLPNGHVFVNWGQESAVTEFRADGTPIFDAFLDTGASIQSYRGFRVEWTGRPREVPAIVTLRDGAEAGVYVSWNGDTEVALWRFYAQDGDTADATSVRKIGEAQGVSFETAVTISTRSLQDPGTRARIFAAGFDKNGNVLSRTREVAVQEDFHASAGGCDQGDELGDL
ncbi:hypothetical protein QQZ08_011837 [Neonectria magnoliae]|uniref:Uncharacterized protein n=1 Tax=Neonectria magnoliae TaxID=2732573 RepID=A0ABR1H8J8_9HYPO